MSGYGIQNEEMEVVEQTATPSTSWHTPESETSPTEEVELEDSLQVSPQPVGAEAKVAVVLYADSQFGAEICSRLDSSGYIVYPFSETGESGIKFDADNLPSELPYNFDVFISARESGNLKDLLGHMKAQTEPAAALVDRINAGGIFAFTMPSGIPRDKKVADWFRNGLLRFRQTVRGFASAVVDPSSPGAVEAILAAAGVLDIEIPAGTHLFTLSSDNIPQEINTSSPEPQVQVDATLVSAATATTQAANAATRLKEEQAGVAAAKEENAALRAEATTAAISRDEAVRSSESASREAAELRKEIAQLRGQRDGLLASVSEAEVELAFVKDKTAEHGHIADEVAMMTEARNSLHQEVSDLEAKASELSQSVIADRARLASLNERISSATAATTSAEAALVNASATSEKLLADAQLSAARTESEALSRAEELLDTARQQAQEILDRAAAEVAASTDEAATKLAEAEEFRSSARQEADSLAESAHSEARAIVDAATETASSKEAEASEKAAEIISAAETSAESVKSAAKSLLEEAATESAAITTAAQETAQETLAEAAAEARRIIAELDVPASEPQPEPSSKRRRGRR